MTAAVFSEGEDIHDGGPRESEYAGRILVMLGTSVGRSALLVLTMGESVLRDPIPSFAQSVARAVGRDGSKLRTPFSHWRSISCLEASKLFCSSGDHMNGTLLDNRCLNGAMMGAKKNEIWLMAQNQLLTSVRIRGSGLHLNFILFQ